MLPADAPSSCCKNQMQTARTNSVRAVVFVDNQILLLYNINIREVPIIHGIYEHATISVEPNVSVAITTAGATASIGLNGFMTKESYTAEFNKSIHYIPD